MLATAARTEPDALILGGGLAGAALGTLLARRGRSVQIIEQSASMHHKVCGEFLSREAIVYLRQLGIDLNALGAVPIHAVRLAAQDCIAECELPFPAMSLTRRRLDEALLALAQGEGARVQRGRRVERLQQAGRGWNAFLAGGEMRRAQTVFLATGKHDLSDYRRPPGKQNDLVAYKMYYRLSAAQQQALHGWVELFLFPGGYAGLQMTEDNNANLCLLVSRAALRACGNQWKALLARICDFSLPLVRRLEGAQPMLARPLALSSIPYGMLLVRAENGLWRLGDQAAVIPSFSGDGMSIALHSAEVAAELYLNGGTAEQYAQRLHQELRASVRLATVLSQLMLAAPRLAQITRFWPSLLRHFAGHTRVPRSALLARQTGEPLLEQ